MKRPAKLLDADPSAWLFEYIWRADRMVANALSGKGHSGWIERPTTKEGREQFKEYRKTAARLVEYIKAREEQGDIESLTAMAQYAALKALADGWRTRRLQPAFRQMRETGDLIRRNRAKANDARKSQADERVGLAFVRWRQKAKGSLMSDGKPLPIRKQAELFVKFSSYKPRSADRRRLFALVKAGKISAV